MKATEQYFRVVVSFYAVLPLGFLDISFIFVLRSREEAEHLLKDKEDGTFLVRESARRRGEYAVGLK